MERSGDILIYFAENINTVAKFIASSVITKNGHIFLLSNLGYFRLPFKMKQEPELFQISCLPFQPSFLSLSFLPLPLRSILGMHLFGCKFGLRTESGDTMPDRKNFDSLLWAIVTVFQVSSLSCPFCTRSCTKHCKPFQEQKLVLRWLHEASLFKDSILESPQRYQRGHSRSQDFPHFCTLLGQSLDRPIQSQLEIIPENERGTFCSLLSPNLRHVGQHYKLLAGWGIPGVEVHPS